jgi:hypothetical protein
MMIQIQTIKQRIEALQDRATAMRLDAEPWCDFYVGALLCDASIEQFAPDGAEGGIMSWKNLPVSDKELARREQLLRPLEPYEKFCLKRLWLFRVRGRRDKFNELPEILRELDCYDAWRHSNFCFLSERPSS